MSKPIDSTRVLSLIGAALRNFQHPVINDVDAKRDDEVILTLDNGAELRAFQIGVDGISDLGVVEPS